MYVPWFLPSSPALLLLSWAVRLHICFFLLHMQNIAATTRTAKNRPLSILGTIIAGSPTWWLVGWGVDVVSLVRAGEWVVVGRCVKDVPWVVTVAVELGPQCLSSLALQCLPEAFKPCLIHSCCSSSFPSKQQYEHCWQVCRAFLAKKYPFVHVPLQILFEFLVQGAVTISSFAHCWQPWHGAESYSSENVSLGQRLQPISGGYVSDWPHTGYNP